MIGTMNRPFLPSLLLRVAAFGVASVAIAVVTTGA
jgi:hypothetical protein